MSLVLALFLLSVEVKSAPDSALHFPSLATVERGFIRNGAEPWMIETETRKIGCLYRSGSELFSQDELVLVSGNLLVGFSDDQTAIVKCVELEKK